MRGQVICAPGATSTHTKFKANIYLSKKDLVMPWDPRGVHRHSYMVWTPWGCLGLFAEVNGKPPTSGFVTFNGEAKARNGTKGLMGPRGSLESIHTPSNPCLESLDIHLGHS